MEKKLEILRDNKMLRDYLKEWIGISAENPIPELIEIMNFIGVDFEDKTLQGLHFLNQELVLFLGNETNITKVSFLKESLEVPKTIKVEKENEIQKFSYLKSFDVTDAYGNILKHHKSSIRLYEYEKEGKNNNNRIYHRWDAFKFGVTLKSQDYELELEIKYPNYLTNNDEMEYVMPNRINTVLLNLKFPVAIEGLYRDLILYGTKRNVVFPSIALTVKKENRVIDQIITEAGEIKNFITTEPDCSVHTISDGVWTIETPLTSSVASMSGVEMPIRVKSFSHFGED